MQHKIPGSSTRALKAYPVEHAGPVPISAMDVYTHRDSQGNKIVWVFTGDEQGMVKLWDATPFANHLPITHLPPEKQPCNLGSYNPRVRLRRVFAGVDHGGITAKERPYVWLCVCVCVCGCGWGHAGCPMSGGLITSRRHVADAVARGGHSPVRACSHGGVPSGWPDAHGPLHAMQRQGP